MTYHLAATRAMSDTENTADMSSVNGSVPDSVAVRCAIVFFAHANVTQH